MIYFKKNKLIYFLVPIAIIICILSSLLFPKKSLNLYSNISGYENKDFLSFLINGNLSEDNPWLPMSYSGSISDTFWNVKTLLNFYGYKDADGLEKLKQEILKKSEDTFTFDMIDFVLQYGNCDAETRNFLLTEIKTSYCKSGYFFNNLIKNNNSFQYLLDTYYSIKILQKNNVAFDEKQILNWMKTQYPHILEQGDIISCSYFYDIVLILNCESEFPDFNQFLNQLQPQLKLLIDEHHEIFYDIYDLQFLYSCLHLYGKNFISSEKIIPVLKESFYTDLRGLHNFYTINILSVFLQENEIKNYYSILLSLKNEDGLYCGITVESREIENIYHATICLLFYEKNDIVYGDQYKNNVKERLLKYLNQNTSYQYIYYISYLSDILNLNINLSAFRSKISEDLYDINIDNGIYDYYWFSKCYNYLTKRISFINHYETTLHYYNEHQDIEFYDKILILDMLDSFASNKKGQAEVKELLQSMIKDINLVEQLSLDCRINVINIIFILCHKYNITFHYDIKQIYKNTNFIPYFKSDTFLFDFKNGSKFLNIVSISTEPSKKGVTMNYGIR